MKKLECGRGVGLFAGCVLVGVLVTGFDSVTVHASQTSVGTGIGAGTVSPIQTTRPSLDGENAANGTAVARQEEMRARQAMDERRKKMVEDTDKLLELITELKSDVDKSTKYETSAAAVKKAAEIEKLAHNVKERMRN